MGFSTWGRVSILSALLLVSCGSNGTGGTVQTATTSNPDPGGPFVANGNSGPFAAAVGATNDFTAKYGNGGPFVSQGASGPFANPGSATGDCSAACQRASSFACAPVNGQRATPQGAAGGASTSNSNSLDSCLRDCATLDAITSTCIRNVINSFIACVLVAPLSCDHNGEVQVEGCPEPDLKPCGATVTQTQVPDQTNTGGPPTVLDGGR
jgi:hypothetical protein